MHTCQSIFRNIWLISIGLGAEQSEYTQVLMQSTQTLTEGKTWTLFGLYSWPKIIVWKCDCESTSTFTLFPNLLKTYYFQVLSRAYTLVPSQCGGYYTRCLNEETLILKKSPHSPHSSPALPPTTVLSLLISTTSTTISTTTTVTPSLFNIFPSLFLKNGARGGLASIGSDRWWRCFIID